MIKISQKRLMDVEIITDCGDKSKPCNSKIKSLKIKADNCGIVSKTTSTRLGREFVETIRCDKIKSVKIKKR